MSASAAETVKDKIAEMVPVPRARPVQTASYRVASAAPAELPVAAKPATAKQPQTMAEMIEARVRWDDEAMTPKPASAEQIAAAKARAADPQSTAALPANVANAMAYASPQLLDRSKIVAASAPVPQTHIAALAHDAAVSVHSTTVVGKTLRGQSRSPATMLRLANADQASDIWLRAMVLTPSANNALYTSVMGDPDMRAMAAHFVKPARAVTITFSLDPQIGPACDHFAGQAVAAMPTTTFVQTAALR